MNRTSHLALRALIACSLFGGVALAGCGDDDAAPPVDAGRPDGRVDATVPPDARVDATVPMPDGGMEDGGETPDGGGEVDAGEVDGGGDLCLGIDCTDMDDACHVGVCDPATGMCGQEARTDGSTCDDMDTCTTADVCTAGVCSGEAVDCSAMTGVCVVGTCNATTGACEATPVMDGTACTDANACTTGDACMAGMCVGAALDCSGLTDQCNTGVCDATTGMCARLPLGGGTTCNDGNACTSSDVCGAGTCAGVPVTCTSLDTACTVGMCSPTTGACVAANRPDGTSCDDANACSTGDVCTAGTCGGMLTCANTCSRARIVMNGTTLTGENLALGTETLATATGCGPALNHAMYYSTTIPAGQSLTFVADPQSVTLDPVVRLLDSCTATTCLGSVNTGADGDTEVLFYDNTTTAPINVVIVLGNTLASVTGLVDVSVTIGAPPANRVCSAATALADGVTLASQRGGLGTDDYTTTTAPCSGSTNNVLYYSLTLAAGQGATVTVQPLSDWNTTVRFLSACAATTCLAGTGSSGGSGAADTASYVNTSGAMQTIFVAVGSTSTTITGLFDITARFGTTPPNAVCSAAIPIAGGTTLANQQGQLGVDALATSTSCGGTLNRALYYSTTIPAGQALVATMRPLTPFPTNLRLLATCADTTTCLATNSGSRALVYENTTGSPMPVLIAAGSGSPITFGAFDLTIDFVPPPANRVCTSATPVTDGTVLRGQHEGLGTDTLSGGTGCGTSTNNGVLYYSATIPAGQQLSVAATPVGIWSAVIRILPACGSTTCTAFADSSFGGWVRGLAYTNTTTSDLPVIIAIGSSTTGARGDFDLAIHIRPPGPVYAESTIAPACADMSGGTVVPSAIGDDALSPLTALPFAFTIAGDAATQYFISSNGHLQLFNTTPTGGIMGFFSNVAIPTATIPNGLIAPFWDDLRDVAGATDVRVLVSGTAPNRRMVVQWTQFTFFDTAEQSARLTFQAQLYETSNVVEYHYCAMSTTATVARIEGSSATVGVEGLGGTLGYQHSFNTAMSVSTTSALRLTPIP